MNLNLGESQKATNQNAVIFLWIPLDKPSKIFKTSFKNTVSVRSQLGHRTSSNLKRNRSAKASKMMSLVSKLVK